MRAIQEEAMINREDNRSSIAMYKVTLAITASRNGLKTEAYHNIIASEQDIKRNWKTY